MLHFVMSYMKQNKSRKQTLERVQYGLEISFNWCFEYKKNVKFCRMEQLAGKISYNYTQKSLYFSHNINTLDSDTCTHYNMYYINTNLPGLIAP